MFYVLYFKNDRGQSSCLNVKADDAFKADRMGQQIAALTGNSFVRMETNAVVDTATVPPQLLNRFE